ncbi:MAG: hypothetical protein WAM82_22005 [Thermoanaerobaculia bacterium]
MKFLICTTESSTFRRATNQLLGHGDLFAWGISASLQSKPRTELIPFPMDFFVPLHLKTAIFEEKPSDPAIVGNALKAALRDEAYILLPFDDTVKGDTSLFVFGRHVRLSPLIRKLMLDTPAKDLITGKRICLPLGERDGPPSIMHILLAAWENRMIPILSERIPHGGEIRAVCDSLLDLPTSLSTYSDKNDFVANELWTKLLWSCQTNPHSSLTDFSRGMRELAGAQAQKKTLGARVYLLRFRAGSKDVVHPAVVALAL